MRIFLLSGIRSGMMSLPKGSSPSARAAPPVLLVIPSNSVSQLADRSIERASSAISSYGVPALGVAAASDILIMRSFAASTPGSLRRPR